MTFKSAFANENVKVYSDCQPHGIDKCLGISYSHFTVPVNVKLSSDRYECADKEVKTFMELINPDTAQVLASYDHPNWKRYAAVTRNRYGKGCATYIGCWTSDGMLSEILADTLKEAGIRDENRKERFPVIIKKGVNDFGKEVTYYLNYSAEAQQAAHGGKDGVELLSGEAVNSGKAVKTKDVISLEPWGVMITEEAGD